MSDKNTEIDPLTKLAAEVDGYKKELESMKADFDKIREQNSKLLESNRSLVAENMTQAKKIGDIQASNSPTAPSIEDTVYTKFRQYIGLDK